MGTPKVTLQKARELQRGIASLRGIRGAGVDVDRNGQMDIRVLVVPERTTSEVRESVRARARQVLGHDIDPERIVVLGNEGAPRPIPSRRVLTSVTTERSTDFFTARVALERDGDVLMGEYQGPRGPEEERVIVHAVLHAVRGLLEPSHELETIEKVTIGDARLAVVWLRGGGRILSGSALLKTDEQEMIARATLHALNRQLGRYATAPDERSDDQLGVA